MTSKLDWILPYPKTLLTNFLTYSTKYCTVAIPMARVETIPYS